MALDIPVPNRHIDLVATTAYGDVYTLGACSGTGLFTYGNGTVTVDNQVWRHIRAALVR